MNKLASKSDQKYPILIGNAVILQPLQESYIQDYLLAFSPLVRQALHVMSPESERAYLIESIVQMREGKTYFYLIVNQVEQKVIGAIAIRDPQVYPGQLYSWVNEHYWGKGYYQEALKLMTSFYFEQTGAFFISAQVDISNIRSYKALKKAGWADKGISKGPFGMQYDLILRNKGTKIFSRK